LGDKLVIFSVVTLNSSTVVSEYLALDTQLDQLKACLDSLEARNDDLVSKMREFLQANQAKAESHPSDHEGGGGSGAASGSKQKDSSTDSGKTDNAHSDSQSASSAS
jgi:hypothetical protein